MTGDFDSGIEQYMKAVNSLDRSYIDFGPLRATTRARLSRPIIEQLEQHPGFKQLMEDEGIDDTWREVLMELVNGLSDITGIQIYPDNDR
jgi:hypothetical protein